MLDSVILGRYVQGDSLIHRLDPRAKLVGCILFFILVFQAFGLIDYGILFTIMFGLVFLSQVGLAFFWRGMRPMLFFILLTAFFQVLFVTSGQVLWEWGFLKVTVDGLWSAFYVTCRFAIIIGMSTLLSLTTNPLMLADAIESLMKPLKKMKVPVHEIALIVSIAMRFVPTILDETRTIMNAQRSRGVNFNEGNLIKRVKAIVPILVPLFASVIRRSEDLANAMEARGYNGDHPRTKFRQLAWHWRDTGLFLVLAGFFALIWLV